LWGSDTPESNPDRLKTLAPPGFSEHHTGYVVDFNSTNATWWRSAEGIKIQNWLKSNASYYNFEQSFTSEYNKAYGVSEEAWHCTEVFSSLGFSLAPSFWQ
jgi:D-alanyl-D-alanine carboxypeptidase